MRSSHNELYFKARKRSKDDKKAKNLSQDKLMGEIQLAISVAKEKISEYESSKKSQKELSSSQGMSASSLKKMNAH